MEVYSADVEQKMKRFFGWLSEKDRRRYAAIEVAKLGHGGIEYIARVLACDPKTIRQGLHDLKDEEEAGLRVARARGRLGGRPKALQEEKRRLAVQLYQEKKVAVKHICELMGISKPTLYAYVRQAQSSS